MRKLLILFLLLPILTSWVSAVQWLDTQTELFGIPALEDGLPPGAESAMEGMTPTEQSSLREGLSNILKSIRSESSGILRSAAALMLRLLCIATICRLAEQQGEPMRRSAAMAGALGVAVCCATDIKGMIGLGQRTVEELLSFSNLLLPVLTSAAAASGGSVSAGGMYGVAAVFSNLLIRFSKGVVYPAVYGYLALALTDSAVQEDRLKKLRDLIGWCIRNVLRIMMYLFTGFLAVTGIISGAADAAAVKAAKVTMSGMIPVVGGIMSEAAETVLAGAGLLKSAVGTYGMIAVTAIFLLPFVRMGVQFLAFKMTAALSGVLGSRLCGLLDAVTEAMGFVLAMTASTAVMSLLSCCCLMKVSGL